MIQNAIEEVRRRLGNPLSDTLTTITAKLGNNVRSLYVMLGTRWDAAGDLGTDIANLLAAVGGGLTDTDNSTGPSNFFAAPVSVLSLAPATNEVLRAFYLDASAFTAGAILTAIVSVQVGAGPAARTIRRTFVAGAANDGTLFAIIDGDVFLKDIAASISITVQSDNAGDIAVTAPGTYWM